MIQHGYSKVMTEDDLVLLSSNWQVTCNKKKKKKKTKELVWSSMAKEGD